ncbi:P-loop containing nucleoside triphosphate hydrolase protein [Exidia glandulosa HHB12029]|uniref:p-loop containing nucleoside triphosphate hydrolase protein n=1 Tax=Exidia glandulosa HHB12029 TaxID=1314781 RepID=A0A166AJM6_EXIGL|nr:P-loop containing nucleoside triphosphate hydrolase protein [Exidia glandulosa HHB12029]
MAAPHPCLIAVMGPTGCGKSSFISALAPGAAVVGHKLVSCTSEVHLVQTTIDGVPCVLIDTPGFDDTKNSDTNTLRLIANYLEIAHKKGQLLNGIVYFHRITDNRVGGVTAKNMRMFRSLCGDTALKNVTLCTTMWDIVNPRDAEQRETELKDNFWKSMITAGSNVVRHDGTTQSALDIVRPLLANEGVPVQLQEELADGVPLSDTASGAQLNEELRKLQEAHRKEMQALRVEMERASGQKLRELEGELKQESAMLRQAQEEQRKLLTERSSELEELKRQLQQQPDRWCPIF